MVQSTSFRLAAGFDSDLLLFGSETDASDSFEFMVAHPVHRLPRPVVGQGGAWLIGKQMNKNSTVAQDYKTEIELRKLYIHIE